MSPEAQRIAIAEACGWACSKTGDCWAWFCNAEVKSNLFHSKKSCLRSTHILPDYLNDLNAMHEAEKTLRPTQARRFISELWPIMAPSKEAELGTFHATAAQRAEAFLKTLLPRP